MAIASHLGGGVRSHRTDNAVVGATLTPMKLPRMETTWCGIRQIERHRSVATLRSRSHGRGAVHLHRAGKIGRSGKCRVPARVQVLIFGAHLDWLVVTERIAGAERKRRDGEQK